MPKLHLIKIENLKTRVCPYCKQEYKIQVGLSNWKNLFRKPTLDDWIVLIILILIMFSAYAYMLDTKTCKDTLNNLDEICTYHKSTMKTNIDPNTINTSIEPINQSFFTNISDYAN